METTQKSVKANSSTLATKLAATLTYKHGVYLPHSLKRKERLAERLKFTIESQQLVSTLQANLIDVGYMLDDYVIERLRSLTYDELFNYAVELTEAVRKVVGTDVYHNVMYRNFPTDVMALSDVELFLNAIHHYISMGTWLPEMYDVVSKNVKTPLNGDFKIKLIRLLDENDYIELFAEFMGSSTSCTTEQVEVADKIIKEYRERTVFPDGFPFKENMGHVASFMAKYELPLNVLRPSINTATDVLRFVTALSGGDVSLAQNTKFKRFKRSERRLICGLLDDCSYSSSFLEDIKRHSNKWNKLFHGLHVGDYAKQYPNVANAAFIQRNTINIPTVYTDIEECIKRGDVVKAATLLVGRPGDFARKLDKLVRDAKTVNDAKEVLGHFESVATKVSLPVLLQMHGHFSNRAYNGIYDRVALPKGNMGNPLLISKNSYVPLKLVSVKEVIAIIENAMISKVRSKELNNLGAVYIEPNCEGLVIPLTQRNMSGNSIKTFGRGSRISVDANETEAKNYIRLFTHWKNSNGQRVDVDLSAMFFDENFENGRQVSYTNLRDTKLGVYHSGDITDAPNGASEFIDINIEGCLNANYRYAVLSVYDFTGIGFANLDECFAGFMLRNDTQSGEIYEPKTLKHKFDLTSNSNVCTPIVFDLVNREFIWMDVPFRLSDTGYRFRGGVNVHNTVGTLIDIIKSYVQNCNKPTIETLLKIHTEARATAIVNSPELADTVFDFDFMTDVVKVNDLIDSIT